MKDTLWQCTRLCKAETTHDAPSPAPTTRPLFTPVILRPMFPLPTKPTITRIDSIATSVKQGINSQQPEDRHQQCSNHPMTTRPHPPDRGPDSPGDDSYQQDEENVHARLIRELLLATRREPITKIRQLKRSTARQLATSPRSNVPSPSYTGRNCVYR